MDELLYEVPKDGWLRRPVAPGYYWRAWTKNPGCETWWVGSFECRKLGDRSERWHAVTPDCGLWLRIDAARMAPEFEWFPGPLPEGTAHYWLHNNLFGKILDGVAVLTPEYAKLRMVYFMSKFDHQVCKIGWQGDRVIKLDDFKKDWPNALWTPIPRPRNPYFVPTNAADAERCVGLPANPFDAVPEGWDEKTDALMKWKSLMVETGEYPPLPGVE